MAEIETQSGFQIETYRPIYEDQVVDLIDNSLKEMGVIKKGEEKIDDPDLRRISQVYSGRGCFWIAIDGNSVIGTVAIRDLGDGTAKLNRMFVKSDHHGKGVGQKLLDRALQHAKDEGFSEVILNTHVNMKRAHRFYEKNGFVRVGQDEEKYHYRLVLQ